MNPFPQFEACSFDFQTDNLEALHSFQLALVPFKQDSNFYKYNQARTIFLQRRQKALETSEAGIGEKINELKRLEKIRETLGAGLRRKVDSCVGTEEKVYTRENVRRVMKPLQEENARLKEELETLKRDTAGTKWNVWTRNAEPGPSTQSTPSHNSSLTSVAVNGVGSSNAAIPSGVPSNAIPSLADPPFRRGLGPQLVGPPLHWNPHTNSLEPVASTSQQLRQFQPPPLPPPREVSIPRQPTPLPTPPPPRSPTPDPSPPGPFFSIISRNSSETITDDLRSRLYVVFVRDLPAGITPLLLLHFLRRPQKQRVPRPVAIAITNAGNVMMAFTSEDAAQRAALCLDGKGLPGLSGQRKIQAESKPKDQYRFKWHQLSDEMREAWNSGGQMPQGEWVSISPPPSRGSVISDDYEDERRCVLEWQRQRAEEERRQREESEEDRRRLEEQFQFEEEVRRQALHDHLWDSQRYISDEERRSESNSDSDDSERAFKRFRFF